MAESQEKTEVEVAFEKWLEENPGALHVDFGLGIEDDTIEMVNKVARSVAVMCFIAGHELGYKEGVHDGIA